MILQNLDQTISALPNPSENITLALNRIQSLRNLLASIGIELSLKKDATTALTANAKLEDVVRAFNSIVKQITPVVKTETAPSNALKVDSGKVVTVEPGYYSEGFSITGAVATRVLEELENLKTAIKGAVDSDGYTASPDAVLVGSKTLQVTENSDGTLSLSQKNGTVGSSSNLLTFKGSEGSDDNKTITLQSNNETTLSTNIPYNAGGDKEVLIKISTTANDETVVITERLPSGYYENQINIKPVLQQTGDNKVINVEEGKEFFNVSPNMDITPSAGFDFIASGKIKSISSGSSSVAASIVGNKITLTPSHTDGWISENPTITGANKDDDGNYVITINTPSSSDGKATVVLTEDNKVEVIPESGYYDGNTSIPLVLKTEATEATETAVNSVGGKTITDTDLTLSNGKYETVAVTAPALVTGTIGISLNESSVTLTGVSGNEITENSITITTNEGFTEGESKTLTVKEASTPTLKIKPADGNPNVSDIIIDIATGGWASGETVVTETFRTFADSYAAGLVDTENGGEALFTYNSDLKSAINGIQEKTPSEGYSYFTSARVDLSDLIEEIDNI